MQTISVEYVDKKLENYTNKVNTVMYIMLGFFILILIKRYVMDKIAKYLESKENVKYFTIFLKF
jgi:hypothetical protein